MNPSVVNDLPGSEPIVYNFRLRHECQATPEVQSVDSRQ